MAPEPIKEHYFTPFVKLVEDGERVRVVMDWYDTYQGSAIIHDEGPIEEFNDDDGPALMDALLEQGAVGPYTAGHHMDQVVIYEGKKPDPNNG